VTVTVTGAQAPELPALSCAAKFSPDPGDPEEAPETDVAARVTVLYLVDVETEVIVVVIL
jgi:hypothetical protein